MFITVDGEMLPKDITDRDAEVELYELAEADGASPAIGGAAGSPAESPMEEVQEVEQIKVRKPPYEPTEAERLRHEATHIPYRSWCPYCV